MLAKFFTIGFSVFSLWQCQSEGEQIDPKDVYIVDGDTIRIAGENLRLLGFNTPETTTAQCEEERVLGYEAKANLFNMVSNAEDLRIDYQLDENGEIARGIYGRALARLFVNGEDVKVLMISAGFAEPYDGGRRRDWCPRRRND